MLRRILFHSIRLVNRASHSINLRLTPAGQLLIAALIVAVMFGIDLSQTLAYQIVALLGCILAISILSSLFFPGQFRVKRDLPAFTMVGETANYRLVVSNDTANVQHGLIVQDSLKTHAPTFAEFSTSHEPRDHYRNRFDRYVGYPRWVWLIRRARGANIDQQTVPVIPPQGESTVNAQLTPLRRGYIHFKETLVTRPDPFGIFKAIKTVSAPQSLLVLPKIHPMQKIELSGARHYQPGGVSLASSVGDADEFMSLRDYRPGDLLRHVHWPSTAKLGQPVVKEYEEEYFVRHALVLDTFMHGGIEDAFEAAVSTAASCLQAYGRDDNLIDLMFMGDQAYQFTAGRGLANTDRMLEIVSCVEPCLAGAFGDIHHVALQHARSLSSCICVLIDWDEDRRNLIAALESRGVPVLVLLVASEDRRKKIDISVIETIATRVQVLDPRHIGEGLKAL